MKKLSVAVALAMFAIAPAAASAATGTFHTTWTDKRDGTQYPITCNETQTGTGNKRTETFSCTPDGAKPPAGHYKSPDAFWYSDFDGAIAKKVDVTIDSNGNVNGKATY